MTTEEQREKMRARWHALSPEEKRRLYDKRNQQNQQRSVPSLVVNVLDPSRDLDGTKIVTATFLESSSENGFIHSYFQGPGDTMIEVVRAARRGGAK